jgi:hypothetical protein
MRTCPRCRSSVVLDAEASDDGDGPVRTCLGCGWSLYVDPERQAEDERLRQRFQNSVSKPESGASIYSPRKSRCSAR